MSFQIRQNIAVRRIHVEMPRGPRSDRHSKIMFEMIERGVYTKTIVSGPPTDRLKGFPFVRTDRFHEIFLIEESAADEYLARMRKPDTKAEKLAYEQKQQGRE